MLIGGQPPLETIGNSMSFSVQGAYCPGSGQLCGFFKHFVLARARGAQRTGAGAMYPGAGEALLQEQQQ